MKPRFLFKRLVEGYRRLKVRPKIPTKLEPTVGALGMAEKLEVMKLKPEPLKMELIPPKVEKVLPEGLEIPKFIPKLRVKPPEVKEEVTGFKFSYPLIPEKPGKHERILAYAEITWDSKKEKFVYKLIEPEMKPELKVKFQRIKNLLEQKLEVELGKISKVEAKEYLHKKVDEIIGYYGFKLTEDERISLHYYAERDFIGLGKIEPLMHDPNIEDISCDGVGIPIFVFHRHPKLGSIETNITFDSPEELDSFLVRLAQLCGKSISVAQPLLSGTLPDGSRVQATLATDIARRGSNFTIRKFSKEPFTPIDLLNFGTLSLELAAYLWLLIDHGCSVLVAGGTATGKTTILNVLSLFISFDKKVVSIEDTPELNLPHPHWVPQVARVPIAIKEGEVDLFALLKESLRQRPDYIIVGEVRGKEAFVLFQQMAVGHPGLATIHADTFDKLLERLTTPPIELPKELIQNLDLILFAIKAKYRDKYVRRISQGLEIIGLEPRTKEPLVNEVFRWDASQDRIVSTGKSVLLKRLAKKWGLKEMEIIEDLKRRMLVLNWMKERNITNYRDVARVINTYHYFPEKVLSRIG